jgi:hypothetical protein
MSAQKSLLDIVMQAFILGIFILIIFAIKILFQKYFKKIEKKAGLPEKDKNE